MGKRTATKHQRHPRDFWRTPAEAVVPLVPHLFGVRVFAEPCAGEGDLVRHLQAAGLSCAYAHDIADGFDALDASDYGRVDAIITNPPWRREVLHKLIPHFARIAPTWLLIDSDWANTRQAHPFMDQCSHIVAIGRVRWIAETKHNGKDNSSWFRFHAQHAGGPRFFPLAPVKQTPGWIRVGLSLLEEDQAA